MTALSVRLPRPRLLALLGVGALALLAALALAGPSSAAKGKVYYLDYNGGAEAHPENVFFTANSGPRALGIDWKRWGRNRTTGKGTYFNHCNCPNEVEYPARLILRKPVRCVPDFGTFKGERIRVYRKGKMRVYKGDGEKSTISISTGHGACR